MQAFIFVDSARSSAEFNHPFIHCTGRLKEIQLLQETPEFTSLQTLVHPTSSSRLLFYLKIASQGIKEIAACCCLLCTCGWVLFLHMLMLALPPVRTICSSLARQVL